MAVRLVLLPRCLEDVLLYPTWPNTGLLWPLLELRHSDVDEKAGEFGIVVAMIKDVGQSSVRKAWKTTLGGMELGITEHLAARARPTTKP